MFARSTWIGFAFGATLAAVYLGMTPRDASAGHAPISCVCKHCAQSAPICFLGVSGFCACQDLECTGGMPCAIVWR